jgi:hypothetical protein
MTEPIVPNPKCIECGESWLPADTDHWRAYWIPDGVKDVLLFYCVACAQREFGSNSGG